MKNILCAFVFPAAFFLIVSSFIQAFDEKHPQPSHSDDANFHTALISVWTIPLVTRTYFTGSFVNLGKTPEIDDVHLLSAAHCVSNSEGKVTAFTPTVYSNYKSTVPILDRTGLFPATFTDKSTIDLTKIKISHTADIFYSKPAPQAYQQSVVHSIAKDYPIKGDSVEVIGYSDASGPHEMECEYKGVSFDYPKQDHKFFTLLHWVQCDSKYVRQGISGGPVLNNNDELLGVAIRLTDVPRWKFWQKDLRNRVKGYVGYYQISRDMLTDDPSEPLRPYLDGEYFYPVAFLGKDTATGSILANFKNGLLHGNVTFFQDGQAVYRSQFNRGEPEIPTTGDE